jgi:hypothetical protein
MTTIQSIINTFYKSGRLKIDLVDLLRQLNTIEASELLKRYYQGSYRMHAVLREQADQPAKERMSFVHSYLNGCVYMRDQFRYIHKLASHINEHIRTNNGSILDCGIWKGDSTRRLAAIFPSQTIHAFDSFEGLPDDWTTSAAGAFKLTEQEIQQLNLPTNSCCYKGWFKDTLKDWKAATNHSTVSLIRIDCDIYSSTTDIFQIIGDMLVPGSVIIFDELIGYLGWEHHEYKALQEYLSRNRGARFEYEYFGETYVGGKLRFDH